MDCAGLEGHRFPATWKPGEVDDDQLVSLLSRPNRARRDQAARSGRSQLRAHRLAAGLQVRLSLVGGDLVSGHPLRTCSRCGHQGAVGARPPPAPPAAGSRSVARGSGRGERWSAAVRARGQEPGARLRRGQPTQVRCPVGDGHGRRHPRGEHARRMGPLRSRGCFLRRGVPGRPRERVHGTRATRHRQPRMVRDSRGNHYLADVVGLLFVAAYLPGGATTDDWLRFTAREVIAEIRRQFTDDGANFEDRPHTIDSRRRWRRTRWGCSSRCPTRRIEALTDPSRHSDRQLPVYMLPGDRPTIVPLDVLEVLGRAQAFTADITKPDGRIPQFGDNDNGRFIDLVPVIQASERLDGADGAGGEHPRWPLTTCATHLS